METIYLTLSPAKSLSLMAAEPHFRWGFTDGQGNNEQLGALDAQQVGVVLAELGCADDFIGKFTRRGFPVMQAITLETRKQLLKALAA